jgi:23S rRNA pseudouridine2605 synthase
MDDDQKKSGRGGFRKDGPKGPRKGPPRDGAGKGKGFGGPRAGGKPSGSKSFGGKSGETRDRPFRKPDGDRPYRKPREDGAEAKPYRARAEGDRPFRKEGDRPFRKPEGDRPYRKPREDGAEQRPRPARADGDRSFRKEGDRPFRKPEGDRPYRKPREDGAEQRPRPARAEGDRPFRKDGDRPFRKPDGDRPPRRRDEGGFAPRRRDGAAPRSEPDATSTEPERIAKRLARAGISSRRDAEDMVLAGRVKVNGVVLTTPAHNVQPGDVIHIDNELLPPIERTRLFLFHKPGGVVTTNRDPEGRKTVFDVLPPDLPRLITVGRLDINTEGLLLLTNDGGLARLLELPTTGWLRRYRARVHGKVDEKRLHDLKDGIAVDGVFYGSIEASLDREQGSNAWLTISLREGKNREVKNVLGALGLEVSRLIRVSFGPFQLGELPEGAVQELKGRTLRDQLGERLIEEAGANFDAPIVNEFSNAPVRARQEDRSDDAAPRRERRGEIGEGGLIKGRKREFRDLDDRRSDALDRLQTSRPSFGNRKEGFGGKDKKSEKPFEQPRARSSNVWMASGARPVGKKKPADDKPKSGPPSGRPRRPRRDG